MGHSCSDYLLPGRPLEGHPVDHVLSFAHLIQQFAPGGLGQPKVWIRKGKPASTEAALKEFQAVANMEAATSLLHTVDPKQVLYCGISFDDTRELDRLFSDPETLQDALACDSRDECEDHFHVDHVDARVSLRGNEYGPIDNCSRYFLVCEKCEHQEYPTLREALTLPDDVDMVCKGCGTRGSLEFTDDEPEQFLKLNLQIAFGGPYRHDPAWPAVRSHEFAESLFKTFSCDFWEWFGFH